MTTFTSKFILPLNKTVETGKLDKKGKKEKERVQVGKAEVPYPTLADFGIQADVAMKDGKPEIGTDGVPVYAKDELDWLQQAIVSAVSAKVRNYFVEGIKGVDVGADAKVASILTMTVDSGKVLPADFDMLTAESARSGEALKLRREAKTDFEAFLAKAGKAANVCQVLGELFFNSSRILGSASQKYVQALGTHVDNWVKGLDEAKLARFTPKVLELQESINNALEKEELDVA